MREGTSASTCAQPSYTSRAARSTEYTHNASTHGHVACRCTVGPTVSIEKAVTRHTHALTHTRPYTTTIHTHASTVEKRIAVCCTGAHAACARALELTLSPRDIETHTSSRLRAIPCHVPWGAFSPHLGPHGPPRYPRARRRRAVPARPSSLGPASSGQSGASRASCMRTGGYRPRTGRLQWRGNTR